MAGNDATFTIGADPTGLLAGLAKAQAAMEAATEKMAAKIKNLDKEFRGVGGAIDEFKGKISSAMEFAGIAAAVEGIKQLAEALNESAERAEKFKQLSAIVGTTTTEFQGLAATAAEAGVGQDMLQRGLLKLSSSMTMARDGSQQAKEQLAKVGITTADLADPAFTAANALYTVAKSGAAAGDVQVLLGQRSTMLMAAFDKLRGGQAAMEAEAAKVNALNSNEIETLQTYKERVAVLGIEYDNLKGHVSAYVVGASGPLVASFNSLISSMGGTFDGLDILKGAFATIESAIIIVIDGLKALAGIVTNVVRLFVDGFIGVGKIMKDALTGNWSELKTDAKDMWANVSDDGAAAFKAWSSGVTDTINDVGAAWKKAFAPPEAETSPEVRAQTGGGGTGGRPKKEHDNNAEIAWMNRLIEAKRKLIRDELAEIDKEMNEEVEIAKVGYKSQLDAKVSSLDQQMAATKEAERAGLIGPMQAFQQERDLLQQKLAAQTEYYEKLKGLAVGNAVELAKLNADEQKSQLDYLRDVERAHQQAAAQVDQQWKGVADRMANGFTNAFATMIQGTMTFHQMVQRMLRQMLIGFVHMEAESVARHLAAEAAKSQASVVSGQVQQASQSDASQQGLMVGGMAAIKKIMNDAYQAASGAFNAVVGIPYVGPILAPPAAAAAFAAVAAFGGGIASASGGYDIPGGVNPMTQLHSREMVLPSHLADPMRDMLAGGGGGGDVHVHLNGQRAGGLFTAHEDDLVAAIKSAHSRFKLS